MQKITYFIGAGASAKALPVMKGMNKRFEIFLRYVESLNRNKFVDNKTEVLGELNETFFAIKRHASPDTYARKLFLRQKEEDDILLLHLKYFLSIYFVWEQSFIVDGTVPNIGIDEWERDKQASLDDRYDVFYANMLKRKELNFLDGVNIISWNYDYQFELAFEEYDTFSDSYEKLGIFPDPSYPEGKDKVNLIKLNGTGGLIVSRDYPQQNEDSFYSRLNEKAVYKERNKISIDEMIDIYSRWIKEMDIKFRPFLNFAWEDNYISNRAIEYAKNIILKTDILIVIGYSFPLFNRDVDTQIFSDTRNIKKVYLQDPSDNIDELRERFDNVLNIDIPAYNLHPKNGNIIHKKGVEQFYIP